jgi:hypothetical protein
MEDSGKRRGEWFMNCTIFTIFTASPSHGPAVSDPGTRDCTCGILLLVYGKLVRHGSKLPEKYSSRTPELVPN